MKYNLILLIVLMLTSWRIHSQTPDTLRARIQITRARQFNNKSSFDSAISNASKALVTYEKNGLWKNQAEALNLLASALQGIGQYDKSIDNAKRALELCTKYLDKDSEEEANAYTALGTASGFKNNMNACVDYHLKAINILKKLHGEHDPALAKSYQNIRFVYYYTRAFDLALEYDNKALLIFQDNYGPNHPLVASAYVNIGTIYSDEMQLDLALSYFEKARDIYLHGSEDPLAIGRVYNSMSTIYKRRNDLKRALDFSMKALNTYKAVVGERHPWVAMYIWNVADIYRLMNNRELFMKFSLKAISVAEAIFGPKHPSIGGINTRIARYLESVGEFDNALKYFHASVIANSVAFNNPDVYSFPRGSDFNTPNDLMVSVLSKGSLLLKKYGAEKKVTDVRAALAAFQIADTLVDAVSEARSHQADKMDLGDTRRGLSEGGIQACLSLYKETNDKHYLDLAFYFGEKNKAGVLKEMIQDISAKEFGVLPEELLMREKEIKATCSSLQSKLQQEQRKKGSKDSLLIREISDRLFAANRSKDSLISSFEKNYPGYFNLKYRRKEVSIANIQGALKGGHALLEFFIGEKTGFLFTVTNKRFEVSSFSMDSVFNASFQQVRDMAVTFHPVATEEFRKYTRAASWLYNTLLSESTRKIIDTEKITQLTIIPEQQLWYLPFDILLTRVSSTVDGDFASLPYLIKDFSVQYSYSASINFDDVKLPLKDYKTNLISFAPSYVKPDSSQALALGNFRDAVTPLKWNQEEAKTLSEITGGEHVISSDATESQFKQKASQYGIIHLAMHALVDNENPLNSKLVFAQSNDTTEDNYLHMFELYNMDLHAQMVVLSACNTGSGALAEGEGVISLARAFAYSGVPAVVMTQWNVDDKATAALMTIFYKGLSNGLNKSEALRQAKIKYLKDCNPAAAYPAYWSAFVCVGDDDPLQRSFFSKTNWLIALTIVPFAGILIWFLVRKRRKSVQFA
jgi:CHAT domain-containing protein